MTFSGSPNPDPGEVKRDEETLQRQRDEKAEQDRLEEERRILEEEVPFWRRQKQLEGDEFTQDPEGPHYQSIAAETGIGIAADFATVGLLGIPLVGQGLYYGTNFAVGYSANALAQWMRGDWDDFSQGEALAAGGFQTIPMGTTAKGLKGLKRAAAKGAVGSAGMAQLEVGIDEQRRLTGKELALSSILGGTVAGGFKSAELGGDLIDNTRRQLTGLTEGLGGTGGASAMLGSGRTNDLINQLTKTATFKRQTKVLDLMTKLNMPDGVFRMSEYNKRKSLFDNNARRAFIELFVTPQRLQIPSAKGTFAGFKRTETRSFRETWEDFVSARGLDPIRDIQVHHVNSLYDSLPLYEGVKWYSPEWWDLTATLLDKNVRPGVSFDRIKNKGNLIYTIGNIKQNPDDTPHGLAHKFYNKFTPDFFSEKEIEHIGRSHNYRIKKAKRWATIVNKSEDVLLEADKVFRSLNIRVDIPFWEIFEQFSQHNDLGYNKFIAKDFQLPDIPDIIKDILDDFNTPAGSNLPSKVRNTVSFNQTTLPPSQFEWDMSEIRRLQIEISNPKLYKKNKQERKLDKQNLLILINKYKTPEDEQLNLIDAKNVWRKR